ELVKMTSENPNFSLADYQQTVANETWLYCHNPVAVSHIQNPTGNATIQKKAVVTPSEPPATTALPQPEAAYNDEIVLKNIDTKTEKIKGENAKIEIPDAKDAATELLFTPYHTVDYFASQGIKLKPNEKPTDKFGEQLKSFTEWLKVLKKTPA